MNVCFNLFFHAIHTRSACRVVTDATSKITSFELRDSSNNPGSFVSYGLRAAGVSEVLDDSPVAYWRLGGPDALLDQSGNGHTLSEVGSGMFICAYFVM